MTSISGRGRETPAGAPRVGTNRRAAHFHVGALTFYTRDAARVYAREQYEAGYRTARYVSCEGDCQKNQPAMLDGSGRVPDVTT